MTGVEKELNRDDLVAYKKFDNNQYSMIPGHTNQKKFADPRPPKTTMSPINTSGKGHQVMVNEDKLKKQEERLMQYGMLQPKIGQQVPSRHAGSLRNSMDVKGSTPFASINEHATPQMNGSNKMTPVQIGGSPSPGNSNAMNMPM